MTVEPFSVLILAGGQGLRLGQDKLALPFDDGTLLQWTADRMAMLSDDVWLVLREGQEAPRGRWRLAHDRPPHRGLLAALAGGLRAARHEWSLAIGCDMPFVSPTLVTFLAAQRDDWQIVVPRHPRGLEPLHAFYRRDILPQLGKAMASDERRLSKPLQELRTLEVPAAAWRQFDPEGRSFVNINTPADLEMACSLLARNAPQTID